MRYPIKKKKLVLLVVTILVETLNKSCMLSFNDTNAVSTRRRSRIRSRIMASAAETLVVGCQIASSAVASEGGGHARSSSELTRFHRLPD